MRPFSRPPLPTNVEVFSAMPKKQIFLLNMHMILKGAVGDGGDEAAMGIALALQAAKLSVEAAAERITL